MEEALSHVQVLEDFPRVDNQAPLEAPSVMVQYQHTDDVNFADMKAYSSERFGYYTEEMKQTASLNQNLRDGEPFLSFLYSYRSLSKAIPQVADNDDANRGAIYEKTLEILQPQVQRMKQLMNFRDTSVSLVVQVIQTVSEARKKEKNFPSEEFLLTLAKSFDMFIVMDALKNMKTSLNNDNSMYKRALSNVKKTTQSGKDETTENQKLYFFLANRDSFTTELKKAFDTEIKDLETVEDAVEMCAQLIESKVHVFPETKHILLKAMAFGIFLLDRDNLDKNSLLKNKKSIDRFSKIIKSTPVVPLFGDMSTTLESIVKKAKNTDPSKWTYEAEESISRSYSVLASLPEVREAYKAFVADYGVALNEAKFNKVENGEVNIRFAKSVASIMQRGCILAGDITRRILEQSAWKFDKPTDPYTNPDCPQDATDYEKVVRFNYNSAERFALIEFISMVKSLQSLLSGLDADYGDVVRKAIHHDVQHFIHHVLSDMISHLSKKKKPSLHLLLHVKEIGGDFLEGYDPAAATLKKKAAKKGKIPQEPSSSDLQPFPTRNVGLGASQLAYMRCLLDAAFNEKAPGMKGGFMKDTDFNSTQVNDLSTFFRQSFFYSYILNFSETLEKCCDLSELWYKEFYLEVSKQIQFPIEMSLPWILTDHILTIENPEMTENLLYPLDLYNDAAQRALHKLKTQYLYDEIEAEVNLAFEQFVFKLAQNVFVHYKCWASSIMMNKGYKGRLEEAGLAQDVKFDAPRNRYKVLLSQRHFQLLGRSIDLGQIMGQRMVQYFIKSINTAIQRFESSDLPQVLELHALIEQNRLTHELLSRHVELGSFEEILAEVDESSSLSLGGRILQHVASEVTTDLAGNFCYNSVTGRFVRAPFSLKEAVVRPHQPRAQPLFMFGAKQFNNAFAALFDLNKNFFGEIHVQALVSILGTKSMPALIGELSANLELLFKQLLHPYVQALIRGFPPSTKLPLFLYKAIGTYEYFYAKLKPLLTYRDLKTEVFQAFREFGNTFCFVTLLDEAIEHENVMSIPLSSPFLGLASSSSDMPPEELFTVKQVMLETRAALAGSGTNVDFVKLGETADSLYRPSNTSYPLFKILLKEFSNHFESVRGEWRGSVPSNDVLEIDYCVEFYRIWSAIQFSVCTPPLNPTEFTTRDLFGEGLAWAGCIFMYLLDQVSRFNIFDFSYHMINVASVEKDTLPQASGLDLNKFVELANFYKAVNDEIFGFLDLVGGKKEGKSGVFRPPAADGDEGTYESFPGEHGTSKRVVTEKKLTPGGI